MNKKIQKGKEEFEKKNFKKALSHLEGVRKDDEWYDFAVMYIILCLMNLKRYKDALRYLDYLIGKHPYDDCLWFDKVVCHRHLDETEKAFKAMGELERIVDVGDKTKLVQVARLYILLGDNKKALKYCNMALDIDENFEKALFEKAHIVASLKDETQMNEVADKLLEVSDGKFISLMPVLLLRMMAKNFRGCYDLINNAEFDESFEDDREMYKAAIYNKMCEKLNAQIICSDHLEVSVDEAIELMLDFQESGRNHGRIKGVEYYVV